MGYIYAMILGALTGLNLVIGIINLMKGNTGVAIFSFTITGALFGATMSTAVQSAND